MKQIGAVLCTIAVLAMGMTACSEDKTAPAAAPETTTAAATDITTVVPTTTTESTVTTTTTTAAPAEPEQPLMMEFDMVSHWNEGESPQTHMLDEHGVCTICGVCVDTFEGVTTVSLSDENENVLRSLRYEVGRLVSEEEYRYYDGLMATYCAQSILYYTNGTPMRIIETDSDGNTVEIQFGEDGVQLSRTESVYKDDGSTVKTVYDAHGAVVKKYVIQSTDDGGLFTSVYDGEDHLLSTEETAYTEDFFTISTYIFYDLDGHVTSKEVWEMTDEGYTTTVYDPDGNVISSQTVQS